MEPRGTGTQPVRIGVRRHLSAVDYAMRIDSLADGFDAILDLARSGPADPLSDR